MITDTAFYRNPNYHSRSDTIDTLDFDRMAELLTGIKQVVVDMTSSFWYQKKKIIFKIEYFLNLIYNKYTR